MAEMNRSALQLLQGAQEYFPALERAIDSARHSIYIESYLISNDSATERIFVALQRARQRGVQVYLLLDGYGAAQDMEWVCRQLQPHGIQIELYRPGLRWLAPQTWRRLHRKLVLIDEHIGFVGGINLISDVLDPKHGVLDQPRLDFAAQVTAQRVVLRMSQAMRRLWWRVSLRNSIRGSWKTLLNADNRHDELIRVRASWRRIRRHLRWRAPPVRLDASRKIRLLLRDNLRFRRSIENWYLRHIDQAKARIWIANAYFVPTLRFRQALMAAARRGVQVQLLLQGNSDQWWTQWATRALMRELSGAGIIIYEYQPSFLHAKAAVIDDAATVGSSNIDPFSLMLSLESNLVAEDAEFSAELARRIEQAAQQAVVVAPSPRPANPSLRGVFQGLTRWLALTLALAALRVFLAFSGTRFPLR